MHLPAGRDELFLPGHCTHHFISDDLLELSTGFLAQQFLGSSNYT